MKKFTYFTENKTNTFSVKLELELIIDGESKDNVREKVDGIIEKIEGYKSHSLSEVVKKKDENVE